MTKLQTIAVAIVSALVGCAAGYVAGQQSISASWRRSMDELEARERSRIEAHDACNAFFDKLAPGWREEAKRDMEPIK